MASFDSTIRQGRVRDHKAVFVRSKTGCTACKARKKKCDETRPECINCSRNNAICEYPRKRVIQKKRIGADNNRNDFIGRHGKKLSAIPYPQAPTLSTPISVNNLSDYPDPSFRGYHLPPILGPGCKPHIWKTSSPHRYAPPTAAQVPTEDAARLTLVKPVSNSQKGKMLAGENFFPFDRELVLERARCSAASWRFQNGTNPSNGRLPEDHSQLFRDILQPKELASIPTPFASPVNLQGYVGERCVVAAPFTCDYGYNIAIGDDVRIDCNCTILDCAQVKIGDRCVIGRNVSIFTTTVPTDPAKRLGSNGTNQGKPVIIEEDCFIGANVTILPGRTVHKGSTVGACSVVTRDVPQFTVVGGNPARFIRAVFQS